jgi:DNA-3-methyladenine glycosylase
MPAAVLIRAAMPVDGLEVMQARRRRPDPPARLVNGPGKLAQAFGIDHALNGSDLCAPKAPLFVEHAPPAPESAVRIGPRVGLTNTPEPWKSLPWRFLWTTS